MFSIFKKKYSGPVDFSGLRCDMHSHLLPGIDDGAQDPQTSVKLINGMKDLGYQELITTPHILSDLYQNDRQTIGAAWNCLQPVMQEQNLNIPLRFAGEYFLDDYFDQLLQSKTPLLCIHQNKVLVEFSFINAPFNAKEKLFQLQIEGYQPVLAHPERYLYLSNKAYDELKDAGCLFQVNILSLTGYYGKPPLELAQYLIRKDYVDLLGTDLHHERHLEALRSGHKIMDQLKLLLDSGRLLNPLLFS
jgi:protein-tyrosine phosphatase